jgi:hypothetical protein
MSLSTSCSGLSDYANKLKLYYYPTDLPHPLLSPDAHFETTGSDEGFDRGSYGPSAAIQPTVRSSTMTTPQSDIDATLAERGKRYGDFMGHARVTQRLKAVLEDELAQRGKFLAPDQQEAIEMILNKLGRIVNGDPNYTDSWHDIAGYAKLVEDRLNKEQAG